jgi:hypothetical protein
MKHFNIHSSAIIYTAALAVVLTTPSCVQDEDRPDAPIELGYAYFPTVVGHYVVYQADSIWHDNPTEDSPGVHDTSQYFIKELIEADFTDASGNTSQRLERYKRNSAAEDWELVDVWFISRNNLNAQKVEENQRYIKMGFPIGSASTWDGNALNILDTWTYGYDSLYVDRTYNDALYPRTVKVMQRENVNFVESQLAFEIYAPEVGLVHRYFRDLTTRLNYNSNPVAANIRLGVEFNWKIIEYGME